MKRSTLQHFATPIPGRTVIIRPGDRLIYKGWELSAEVLAAIVTATDKRLLWRFTQGGSRIQPVALDERKVIWLDESTEEGG